MTGSWSERERFSTSLVGGSGPVGVTHVHWHDGGTVTVAARVPGATSKKLDEFEASRRDTPTR